MPRSRRSAAASRVRCALCVAGGNPGIECLARTHDPVKRLHGFRQRCIWIEAVRIEDVEIVEPGALQALVAGGDKILGTAHLTVGSRPHPVTRLGGDHQLVAIGREIVREDLAERFLSRTGGRAVVVGKVEIRDAKVKGGAAERLFRSMGCRLAKAVSKPKRDHRQHQSRPPAPSVGHCVISGSGGGPWHGKLHCIR